MNKHTFNALRDDFQEGFADLPDRQRRTDEARQRFLKKAQTLLDKYEAGDDVTWAFLLHLPPDASSADVFKAKQKALDQEMKPFNAELEAFCREHKLGRGVMGKIRDGVKNVIKKRCQNERA